LEFWLVSHTIEGLGDAVVRSDQIRQPVKTDFMRDRWKITIAPLPASAWTGHAAGLKVTVFDFKFVDTSPRLDQQTRPARLGNELRNRLAKSGRVDAVDTARARASNLWACGGCAVSLVREFSAGFAINGWVQKVSKVILGKKIVVRVIFAKSAEMRGNSDGSLSRTLNWQVRDDLMAQGEGVA
jgi:hypothetical protein